MTDDINSARKRVQEGIERAEEEHKRALQMMRIEVAQTGLKSYRHGKAVESAQKLRLYLRILENWKGVNEGGLTPRLFDPQKDAAELLLISGVYWILVRVYDQTRSDARKKDFVHFLEKYVLFSKGMSYQRLCAETMRKYIANGRPNHKTELKNAYKLLALSKCFVATSLLDVTAPETLPRLRAFRDERLICSPLGRNFVAWYYRQGPRLAERVDRWPQWARRCLGLGLDVVSRLLEDFR